MKRNFTLFASVLMLFALIGTTNAQQDANGWFWINGQPQGNNIYWTKVIDASNIVAVTGRGIFMKSTNGGDSWSLKQVGAKDLSSTSGLNRNDLYTGWFFDANTGIVAGQPEFSDFNSRTVVMKTTDGGTTWSTKEVNGAAGGSIKGIHFINSNTGFVCGGTNANLYKTTNQGETWTSFANVPNESYHCIYAIDENNISLGTTSARFVKTSNGGATWGTQTVNNIPSSADILAIAFKDANTGFATGDPNFHILTTDGGATWNYTVYPGTDGKRAIAYSNGAVWVAGEYLTVYKSTNEGSSWQSITFYDYSNGNQPLPFIVTGIGINNSDISVVGYNGQVTISNDGGATWRNKNYSVNDGVDNTYTSLFVRPLTDHVWVGSNGGTSVLHTSNSSFVNWSVQPTSHTTPINGIDFVDASTGYICGGNGFLGIGEASKTTNSGANWNQLSLPTPLSFSRMNCVDFINANTGWLGGTQGAFFAPILLAKTTDGGTTWTEQFLETNPFGAVVAIKMLDANNGYLLANSIYKTTNGGNNWIKSTNQFVTQNPWYDLFVLNNDVLFLCGPGDNGTKLIAKSIDGGQTWSDITSNLLSNVNLFRTEWITSNHGVVSGTNGYMAKTTDGGLTWTGSNPGISTVVDVAMSDKTVWLGISDRNGAYPISYKLEDLNSISLDVYGIVEGFWNGTEQCADTVTLELRSATSPYGLVEQTKGILSTTLGFVSAEFTSAPSGNYYIVVKHRNALETWSAAPVSLKRGYVVSSYDFTSAASQSYGNNTVLKSGKYCFYSGDVNQDGIIDASDASLIGNDAFNFVSGYTATDVNCDSFVDATDASITDNNVYNIVTLARP